MAYDIPMKKAASFELPVLELGAMGVGEEK